MAASNATGQSGQFFDPANLQLRVGDSVNGLFFNGQGQYHARRESGNATIRIVTVGPTNYQSYLACDRALGSFASPGPLTTGAAFCSMVGVGNDGNPSSLSHGPELKFTASEPWNPSSHGSEISAYVVTNGTTSQIRSFWLNHAGQILARDGADGIAGGFGFISEPGLGMERYGNHELAWTANGGRMAFMSPDKFRLSVPMKFDASSVAPAVTGTRFVCIDTSGQIFSSVTPCSGT